MTAKTFRAIDAMVLEAVRQKIAGKNSLTTHRRFSAKGNFVNLISYKNQKSESDQNQSRHAIKTRFTRQLPAACMQLTGSEGHL